MRVLEGATPISLKENRTRRVGAKKENAKVEL